MHRIFRTIQYASDLHLEKGYIRNIKARNPYLILAGDIGKPYHKSYKQFLLDVSENFDKVFILSGNHEYDNIQPADFYKVDNQIRNICEMRNNLFFVQKSVHLLDVSEKIFLAGCTLWSQFPKIKYETHLEHEKWLYETIVDNPRLNYVIATHHCPSNRCLWDNTKDNLKISSYFSSDQSDILYNENVISWIHGHSHLNRNIKIFGKWVVSNQYGNAEKPLKNYKE